MRRAAHHRLVHAGGLLPGRYGLFLVKTAFAAPPGGFLRRALRVLAPRA